MVNLAIEDGSLDRGDFSRTGVIVSIANEGRFRRSFQLSPTRAVEIRRVSEVTEDAEPFDNRALDVAVTQFDLSLIHI